MTTKYALVWFRQDLRLTDHPALHHAAEEGYSVIPLYIFDDVNSGEWKRGAASKWWLHNSLEALKGDLHTKLIVRRGDPKKIIPDLIKQTDAKAVFWNRCYEPWQIDRDKDIKSELKDKGIIAESFYGSLLWEPWEIKTQKGDPYKVFTPYYKKGCLNHRPPHEPLPVPKDLTLANVDIDRVEIADLGLMPKIKWYEDMAAYWAPGEKGAQQRLEDFLDDGLKGYKEERNRPDKPEHVSHLSPHLHFGEISPRQVWYKARTQGASNGWEKDTEHFCSELGWREFSYYLLYHFPKIPREPLYDKYKKVPWNKNKSNIERWQKGQTGIPIVDAGMRQLWQTGWMHNRVRMIVASLLIKNMLTHWHEGEDWFWDCLVDADLANNSASWQWVAGCGADAAPYFRVFNPVLQGEKFDPNGEYVRKYVPELKDMPNNKIHKPWESDKKPDIYPDPIVDLKESRKEALAAYEEIKSDD